MKNIGVTLNIKLTSTKGQKSGGNVKRIMRSNIFLMNDSEGGIEEEEKTWKNIFLD